MDGMWLGERRGGAEMMSWIEWAGQMIEAEIAIGELDRA